MPTGGIMKFLPISLDDLKKHLLLGEALVVYARNSPDNPLEPFKLNRRNQFLFWDTNEEEWGMCGDSSALVHIYNQFYQLIEENV